MKSLSLDAKALSWYIRENLGSGSHQKIASESASNVQGRSEAAQYQFLSMLMNRDGPFNLNQRLRLDEEYNIKIETIRELYHNRFAKKNADNAISGNQNVIGDNNLDVKTNYDAITYLLKENESLKDQVKALTNLLSQKEKQITDLIQILSSNDQKGSTS